MDEGLDRLRQTELEIVTAVHEFCKKHEIHYSLYAGTLLGAVRHKGFIPWDDDVDICMAREEYDRFIKLWDEEKPQGFVLQNKENTPRFPQSFTKIRKDATTFIQSESEAGRYHNGIFLDVFPIDRMPDGTLARKLFSFDCFLYQLLTREFVPPKSGALVRLGAQTLLRCFPAGKRAKAREKLLARITRYRDPKLNTVAIETTRTIRTPLPADLLDEYTTLTFEGREFMCFAAWDEYLRRKYGDYRTLPPASERVWTHHPVMIDFDHNYEEIKERQ